MPDDLRLLFVGINPGLVSAATGLHFARRGNRFYPALRAAGLIDSDDPAAGSTRLAERGVGITNLVARATARADQVDPAELIAGAARIEALVLARRPSVVAFAGITSYRAAYSRRGARPGRQDEEIGGAEVWVVPNPSGLNAHETVASLAAAYREVAVAAGVLTAP